MIQHILPKLTTQQKILSLESELTQLKHEFRSAKSEGIRQLIHEDILSVMNGIEQLQAIKAKEDAAQG